MQKTRNEIDNNRIDISQNGSFVTSLEPQERLESQNQLLSADSLFLSHIFIVDGIIKKLYYNNYLKDDLRQVGLLGLFKAANKFNNNLGVKFSTYASYFVLGEIKRELRYNKNIKLGKKILQVINLLKEDKTLDEIKSLGFSNDDICLALEYKDLKYDNIDYYNEIIEDNTNKLKITLSDLSNILNGELFDIIKYKYYLNYSQKEIGEMLNFSQSKVSRLEELALYILKKHYS